MTQLNLAKLHIKKSLKPLYLTSAMAITCTALVYANPSGQEQSLTKQKVYLESQLKDLEAKEQLKQEIDTLESKIQFLKEKQGLAPQQPQQTQLPAHNAQTPTQEPTPPLPCSLDGECALGEQGVLNEEKPQNLPFEVEPMNKEKSGFFVGLSAGVASLNSDLSTSYFGSKGSFPNRYFTSIAATSQAVGIYGIVLGVKHGITGGFGLRYYVDLNYAYEPKHKIWSMTYGFNIDGLLNIVEKNNNFFGFFGGVGVGGQTHGWSNKVLENALYAAGSAAGTTEGITLQGNPTNHANQKFANPITSINVAINFGIRGNIAKHHDIELGVRFRPLRSKLIEEKLEFTFINSEQNTTKFGLNGKVGSPYDIFLRYNYVF